MKIIIKVILLSLCIIVFSSCNSQINTTSKDLNKYEGVYKYEYEHNTESSIEDHYIVLEEANGILQGRYYGTSDDFDEAREGYKVGFFVSNMRNLQIRDNTITFNIQLQNSDVFTKPIDLIYKSSNEISLDKNPNWDIGLRRFSCDYKGKIGNGEIKLDTEFGQRVFNKIR